MFSAGHLCGCAIVRVYLAEVAMQNFLLFYKTIRTTLIDALPRPVDFDTLAILNQALLQGELGEAKAGWTIGREMNSDTPGSMFVTVPNYDYFFVDAQNTRVEEPGLEVRELIADFEATLNWMVLTGHLYGEKGSYVILEKCLRTLTPEIALSA